MKCNSPLDPLTGTAIVGAEREQALGNPSYPRCQNELSADDAFCPVCGAKVEKSNTTSQNGGISPTKIYFTMLSIVIGAILFVIFGVPEIKKEMQVIDYNNSIGEYNRAISIFNTGVEQYKKGEFNQAVESYRKASEKGVAAAILNLGVCYANGQGVPQDMREAAKLFRKAAEEDDATEKIAYPSFEYMDTEVRNNKWELEKQAREFKAVAQCNLGECYERGAGVSRDIQEAVEWYRKAADNGNENAKSALRRLGQ